MHGLINRSIQSFVRDTYGEEAWARIAQAAGLSGAGFETMLHYDDSVTGAVLQAAADVLARPAEVILEDLGTYLVSHPNVEALRRLLRFGGRTFPDFLDSLDELPGRGRLAVPDLELPQLDLEDEGGGQFLLTCRGQPSGFGYVMAGVLRAMADDYGALALLEHEGADEGGERLSIRLLDARFASGRQFSLATGEHR